MNDAVWVSLVGAFATVLTAAVMPLLRERRLYREKVADRDAEWARQDVLAQRLAAATAQADHVAEQARQSRANMTNKLDVIHTLVNGGATQAMRNELAALTREVALRREIKAIKAQAGLPISAVGLATIEFAEARITELRADLNIKLEADAAALEVSNTQNH